MTDDAHLWIENAPTDDTFAVYCFLRWEYVRRNADYRAWVEECGGRFVHSDRWGHGPLAPNDGPDSDALLNTYLDGRLDSLSHPVLATFTPRGDEVWMSRSADGGLVIELPPGLAEEQSAGAIGRHVTKLLEQRLGDIPPSAGPLKISLPKAPHQYFTPDLRSLKLNLFPRIVGLWLYDGILSGDFKHVTEAIEDLAMTYKSNLPPKYASAISEAEKDRCFFRWHETASKCIKHGGVLPEK